MTREEQHMDIPPTIPSLSKRGAPMAKGQYLSEYTKRLDTLELNDVLVVECGDVPTVRQQRGRIQKSIHSLAKKDKLIVMWQRGTELVIRRAM